MAFINRIGDILKQAGSKHLNLGLPASNSSIYQAIRCMSSSKIFVGGLSYGTDEMSFREAFAQYGEVVEAKIVKDRQTGRSRGFGFIGYTSTEEASSAMQAMDGQDLHGRRIRVSFAMERPRGVGFGSGGYDGGGGFYSGGGGSGNSCGGARINNYDDDGGDGNYSGGSGYGGGNYGTPADGCFDGGMSSFNGCGGNSANYNPTSNFFNSNSGAEQFGSQVDSSGGGANEDFGQDLVVDNVQDENDEPLDYANTKS